MGQALVLVWWSSVVAGGLALLVSALSPSLRRTALTAAAAGFSLAGVLGILSIGLVFVLLAAACAFAAARTSAATG